MQFYRLKKKESERTIREKYINDIHVFDASIIAFHVRRELSLAPFFHDLFFRSELSVE